MDIKTTLHIQCLFGLTTGRHPRRKIIKTVIFYDKPFLELTEEEFLDDIRHTIGDEKWDELHAVVIEENYESLHNAPPEWVKSCNHKIFLED